MEHQKESTSSERNKWIFQPPPSTPDTKLRLFCVPQAGSGAWVYQEWQKELPREVQVMPVELPGRNSRMSEPRPGSMGELVEGLLAGLAPLLAESTPFVFFGHSLGAWVAYAAAQELNRRGGPLPLRLYVSGMRSASLAGPAHDVDGVLMHRLPAKEFWAAMERRYGANPDLEDPSVRKFIYPQLVADFKLGETYLPASSAPLPCPVVALGGSEDPRYNPQQLAAWQSCTQPGQCRVRWFPGGHNYLFKESESRRAFLDFLAADLRQLAASSSSSNGVPSSGRDMAAAAAAAASPHGSEYSVGNAEAAAGGGGVAFSRSPTDGASVGGGPGSVHSSMADDASMVTAATVGSTGSAAFGSSGPRVLPPSAAAMSRAGRKLTAEAAAQPDSPKWEVPPPERGCFNCVFCSWKH